MRESHILGSVWFFHNSIWNTQKNFLANSTYKRSNILLIGVPKEAKQGNDQKQKKKLLEKKIQKSTPYT